MNDLIFGTYIEKRVGFGRDSCEKRKIIHRISLISNHRCTCYDIWAVIMNMKYNGLMRLKGGILIRLK